MSKVLSAAAFLTALGSLLEQFPGAGAVSEDDDDDDAKPVKKEKGKPEAKGKKEEPKGKKKPAEDDEEDAELEIDLEEIADMTLKELVAIGKQLNEAADAEINVAEKNVEKLRKAVLKAAEAATEDSDSEDEEEDEDEEEEAPVKKKNKKLEVPGRAGPCPVARVAQLEERRTEGPRVGGSIPPSGT